MKDAGYKMHHSLRAKNIKLYNRRCRIDKEEKGVENKRDQDDKSEVLHKR